MTLTKGSNWFLRGVLVAMAIVALLLCIFALPSMELNAPKEFPNIDTALYLFVTSLYLSIIPFLFALLQGWKLLSYIDQNTAFSQQSVRALQKIKYCAMVGCVLFATGIPVMFQIAEIDDAPGMGIVALAFAGFPLVFATFAAVLEKLVRSGIEIKSENELTV